jgi:hypothetical protein
MINYICATLCGLCALLLVVILRQQQKIRHLKVENDTLSTLITIMGHQKIRHLKENDPGRILTGIVIELKNRELLKSEEKNDE